MERRGMVGNRIASRSWTVQTVPSCTLYRSFSRRMKIRQRIPTMAIFCQLHPAKGPNTTNE
ncbi:unnamed protein product, partial [Sphacelaria rigidula]